jgi:hypothetical protein
VRRRIEAIWAVTILAPLCAAGASRPDVPSVAAVQLEKIGVSSFSDRELERQVPYYLAHFHRLANSIQMSGPNRGFITLPVWRRKQDNRPYNARVLENHVSLAYFYSTSRPWNLYYGDAAVRVRLEALLDFWCRSQNRDGRFSEYGPEQWNLAATGFATLFMGGTLTLLHDGPPIDGELHRRVIAAHRKAISVLLTEPALFDHGRSFSNQYSGLWSGILAHLRLYPDQELEQTMRRRLDESLREHMSPAGYWYERAGCDWAYTRYTHHGNLAMAWHYARGTDLEASLVRGETRWAQWLAYNLAREPDGSGHALNRAIETRRRDSFEYRESPLAERVPLARAFAVTDSEIRNRRVQRRRELERRWPDVGPLESYSPHYLLGLPRHMWYPRQDQRQEAVVQLPYMARRHFNHQRADNRFPQVYTFIRRRPYYAVFNAGQQLADQQRFGLGLLWNDRYGALLQSQTGSRSAAWGTRAAGDDNVFEKELVDVEYRVEDKEVTPQAGTRDLDPGDLKILYALPGGGTKSVSFDDGAINAAIQFNGDFVEHIPLLLHDDAEFDLGPETATLVAGGPVMKVTFSAAAQARVKSSRTRVVDKRLVVLELEACDALTYRMSFPKSAPGRK